MHNLIKDQIQQLINIGLSRREALIEIEIILSTFGVTKKDILLDNYSLSEGQQDKLKQIINERVEHKTPIQYLTSIAYFMGYKFYVDENVLIPRPETELLVEKVINLAAAFNIEKVKIIDIGTGSGCIPVALALNLNAAEIYACDISINALNVARINAKKHNVLDKISFIHSNLLEDVDASFDIIVSNPPYIPPSEKEKLQHEVIKHEPHLALFTSDSEGLEFYRKIIEQSVQKLNNGGYIAFEMGINQSLSIKQLLEESGFENINIIKDYSGIDRVITAKFMRHHN